MNHAALIRLSAAGALCAIAGVGAATAQDARASFVQGPGFEARGHPDVAAAWHGHAATATPVEKALLAVDALEARIDRLRYVLRRERKDDAEFIEVARYNLGPTLRAEAIKEYGRENAASAAEFGVGPNVAWRFVFRPDGELIAASRKALGQAAAARCPQGRCLSTATLDGRRKWTELAASPFSAEGRPYPGLLKGRDSGSREVAPARIAFDLAHVAASFRDHAQRDDVEEIAIDRNLAQEINSDAALIFAGRGGGVWVRCGYSVASDGPVRSCSHAAGPAPAAAAANGGKTVGSSGAAVRAPTFGCAFYASPRFEGARFLLKAEKPGRGLVYGDAQSLPAAVSGQVRSVLCAPQCQFFAHDRVDHDGEEYKGAAGATLPELGDWAARIRSAGVSCKV